MRRERLIAGVIGLSLLIQPVLTTNTYAASKIYDTQVLKFGMKNQSIEELQYKLKELGYFNTNVTGYFGSITKSSVKKFQEDYGLKVDGIVGIETLRSLIIKKESQPQVSRGMTSTQVTEWSWFGKIKDIIPRGTEFRIIDVETGKSFNVKRTYGTNHADSETLTQEDTNIMKELYDNEWSWARRPIIVEIGDYKLPASMAGMPHGSDFIKGNGMDGHFDVHFLQSKTHGTNRVDPGHQEAVRKAQEAISLQKE